MKNEIWKPIVGYDHPYKVSNHGRVLGKYGVLRPYDNLLFADMEEIIDGTD